jgi:hypothetical protein
LRLGQVGRNNDAQKLHENFKQLENGCLKEKRSFVGVGCEFSSISLNKIAKWKNYNLNLLIDTLLFFGSL